MKKIWAILCVIGFTAFWTYALAVTAALFGERLFQPMELSVCLLGLAIGCFARWKVLHYTPAMHGRRAASRVRLDREYLESAHS